MAYISAEKNLCGEKTQGWKDLRKKELAQKSGGKRGRVSTQLPDRYKTSDTPAKSADLRMVRHC